MFFIVLTIGSFFFLAYVCIFCPIIDGFVHVVDGVGWKQFSTTIDIGITRSMSISISSTTFTFVSSLKRGVVALASIVGS